MFMASHYFDGIFFRHDLIKPRLDTWKLFSQLALNSLNNGSFQLDAVGYTFLLVKFLEHDLGGGAPTGMRAEAKRGSPTVRVVVYRKDGTGIRIRAGRCR